MTKPVFSGKQYIQIAKILNLHISPEISQAYFYAVISIFCEQFEKDNHKFNRDKFKEACYKDLFIVK